MNITQHCKYLDGPHEASDYQIVADLLAGKAPTHCLVFGCGKDSSLWTNINLLTLFVEDKVKQTYLPPTGVCLMNYVTRVNRWKLEIDRPPITHPILQLLALRTWGMVIIDGPNTMKPLDPGRLTPIAWSAHVRAMGGTVVVHDCNRELEAAACDRWLGSQFTGTHMRIYT